MTEENNTPEDEAKKNTSLVDLLYVRLGLAGGGIDHALLVYFVQELTYKLIQLGVLTKEQVEDVLERTETRANKQRDDLLEAVQDKSNLSDEAATQIKDAVEQRLKHFREKIYPSE